MFHRIAAQLLNNDCVAEKPGKASQQGQNTEQIGYHHGRGILGQPSSFYVGMGLGIIFQAALVTISIAIS